MTSFQIAVEEAKLDTLRRKLEIAQFPDELDDAKWDYGVPLADVKRLVDYWRSGFDWRKQERKLNEMPQYVRKVAVNGFGSLEIHYVHNTNSLKEAIPLLFVHGCMCKCLKLAR